MRCQTVIAMPVPDCFRCCWLIGFMLLVSATPAAAQNPPPQASEPPWKANEKRWLAQSQTRVSRLTADQRRRLDEALELFNRGHSYQDQADYGRSEPLYRQAAEMFKETVGEDDPLYLRCLNNLAVVCQDTGDYPQAVRLLERLEKDYGKNLGETHPLYALALHNLGDALQDSGDRQRAEPLLLRSLEIIRGSLGKKNGLFIQNLANLAKLHVRQGDFAQAEKLYLQTLAIHEGLGGKEGAGYAVQLGNLAQVYQARGDFKRAEETLLRAEALREKLGRHDWPVPGTSRFNLGSLYYDKQDFSRAETCLRQSLQIIRQHFDNTVLAQSERRQLNLARSLRGRLDLYLSLGVEAHLTAEQMYEEMLAFKGCVFAQQHWVHLARHRAESDAETEHLNRQLRETARELSEATFAAPDPQKARTRQERIQQLSERKEQLEADLARRSATFSRQRAYLRQTPADVKAALPSGAALLDFLEYRYRAPATRGDKRSAAEWHMLAVVVRPDRPLEWRDLGSAQAISRACDNWRESLTAEKSPARSDLTTAGAELRRLVWQPLETLLDGARILFVSPDGPLASIPLGSLPGAQPDTYLLEERAIAVLPVPKLAPELLAAKDGATSAGAPASLLLLGDVEFDARPERPSQKGRSPSGLHAARGSRSFHFDRLAGTAREIESIRASFLQAYPDGAVSEVRRAGATKNALVAQVGGKRFLHLATHGFFAPPELQSGLSRPRSAEGASRSLFGYHPGVLSGLALAGAGRREDSSGDDGILTALEVAGLDLSAAELVVLSACETGLGGAAGGEGLLGLQRAFQIAGARSVIASLWKVDDEVTQQLMDRFYANLWQKRLPPLEALRQAQLYILRHAPDPTQPRGPGIIKPVPENASISRTHPRLWAAWVLSGDPGDLTQLPASGMEDSGVEFASAPIDPVEDQSTHAWAIWLAIGVFVVVVILLTMIRSRLRLREE